MLMHNFDKITWQEIDDLHLKVVLDIYKKKWIPDIIVGIVRGGAIPGIMISHTMDIPFFTIDIRLRDSVSDAEVNWKNFSETIDLNKKYLFVDDINDCGDTINFILEKWDKNYLDNIKTCTLYEKFSTNVESDYNGKIYYKEDWLIFPWENEHAD